MVAAVNLSALPLLLSGLSAVAIAATPLTAPAIAAPNRLDADERVNIDVYKTAIPSVVTVLAGGGSGAGTIVSRDGLVLTNDHVVRGSLDGSVRVTVQGNKTYPGTVIARDRQNDLALIRLQTREPLPALRFADPNSIEVGQKAFAIGNPFGLAGTFTTGIVSRIDPRRGDIQTDAALNPGNSGGPLLNSSGELIGVNKAILSPGGGGNVGIGFATNVRVAQAFVERNRRNPGPESTEPLASRKLPAPSRASSSQLGVVVDPDTLQIQQVRPGSAARAAGLRPGDRIVGVNGYRVRTIDDLAAFLERQPRAAVFVVLRDRRLGLVEVEF